MLFDRIRRAARTGTRLAGSDVHAAIAVNTRKRGATTIVSSVSDNGRGDLSDDEVQRQEGEALPERTQLSVLRLPTDPWQIVPPEVE